MRYTRAVDRDHPDCEVVLPQLPLGYDPARVVELLGPLVTPARLARFQTVVAGRTRTLIPVLDGLSDPHNGAAIVRSADAFGCHEVHLVAGRHPFAVAHKVSRGAHRWLDLVRHETADACVDALEARGYSLFVADMDGTLTPEDLARVPRAAVVVGNERRGVSEVFRDRAAGVYRIPMVGFVESLNVSVASAITLYVAAQGRHGDLDDGERTEALARMLVAQVHGADRILAATLGPPGVELEAR